MGWFDRLDSCLRPQPRLDQRTAHHGSEPVAADIHLGVVAHRPECGNPCEHQVKLASDRVDLPKQGHCMRRVLHSFVKTTNRSDRHAMQVAEQRMKELKQELRKMEYRV